MTDLSHLKKRVEVLFKDDIPVHIILDDGMWLNGYIINIYDDYFDFVDRKIGQRPVFFTDIKLLEFFKGDLTTLEDIKKEIGKDGTARD